ncbi:hypothetical protein YC2023_095672 [Brassica napus]
MEQIPQKIHQLREGISVRPITDRPNDNSIEVTLDGPIYPVHTLVPQNYRNLLRLATTPTYLPDNNDIQYVPGKLLLHSSPATNFYFNKSIDYIKHFKRKIRDHAKPCSTE